MIRGLVQSSLFIALLTPAASAQGSASRTYAVKRGDTLWEIAQAVLGDSYLWPEIYRLNTALIEDPHWIYPGQTLALPGGGTAAGTAAAVAMPVRQDEPAPRVQNVARGQSDLFRPKLAPMRAGQQRDSLVMRARVTAVRPGEYLASPYMWGVGGPKDAGRVGLTAESQGIDMTLENRPMQPREPMFIKLPREARGQPGEELLVYRLGAIVDGQGQVVIPTGIVRLSSVVRDGYSQAVLMKQFEDVYTGQLVTSLDTLSMPKGVFPRPAQDAMSTRITWLYNDPVLATTLHYAIVAATAKDLKPGDQLSLRRPHTSERDGAVRAEEEVAVAQVTRVTLWGASIVVLTQQQVGIVDGMWARVSARMP